MKKELVFTKMADLQLIQLENDPSQKRISKDVNKALALMETNLRHPSLNTHEYKSLKGLQGEKVFEAYAQQKTPCAYRILWHYGPERNELTIVAIIPHPD